MVEHQRSILAVLGIDLWVPKTDVPTRTITDALYRDQVAPEYPVIHHHQADHTQAVLQPSTQHQNIQEETKNTHAAQEVSLLLKKVEVKTVEYVETELPKTAVFHSNGQSIEVDPFVLQACSTENYTLLVNATELSEDQVDLWRNIQKAASGQYNELKWPFALQSFQDGRGASLYIQGFLDSIRTEKRIIAIGHIHAQCLTEEMHKGQFVQLASLQEMLDNPQLKRTLWQQMTTLSSHSS
ncbi:hypothetical protein [Acinetobacter shaoyimingii]|uniref:Uncharacterized protein n=1 Tax=Acinetobacter shaoyimingii TaxID=2715164 RepID=A0A6G8RWM3_9GAMM|nr:hypothetical protein [Acinetobacter shaoyimingii]QIO06287.1 hypothetical protein G8E00_10145 [Acinetobacter shaoyimingii]